MTILKSPIFLLWLLVGTFCLTLAELGRLIGNVPRPVLDGLAGGVAPWWDLPAVVHATAFVIGGWVVWLLGRFLLADVSRPRTGIGRVLAGFLVLLGVFLCLRQFGEMNHVVSRVTDFGTIYRGSEALFAGSDPYEATGNGYFYPPLLAFLFGALTVLPPAGASLLFFSLKFVLVVWTLVACDRLVDGRRFVGGRRVLFVFGLVFIAARFWIADLQFGNTNVLIMALVVASIVLDRDDRHWAAGLTLALAVSIKIVPVVLCLHYLVTRRSRTLIWFATTMAAINLLPWIFLHGHWWDTWGTYADAGITGKLNQRLDGPDNQSLWGVISRLFPAQSMSALRWVWLGACSLLALFAGFVSLISRRRDSLVQVAAISIYPLLGLLVCPGSWVVHYTAVLLPMAVLWTLALAARWPARWAWPLFFATNLAFTASGWARLTVKASITQSWFVVAAVLLLAGLGTWVLRSRGEYSVCRSSSQTVPPA